MKRAYAKDAMAASIDGQEIMSGEAADGVPMYPLIVCQPTGRSAASTIAAWFLREFQVSDLASVYPMASNVALIPGPIPDSGAPDFLIISPIECGRATHTIKKSGDGFTESLSKASSTNLLGFCVDCTCDSDDPATYGFSVVSKNMGRVVANVDPLVAGVAPVLALDDGGHTVGSKTSDPFRVPALYRPLMTEIARDPLRTRSTPAGEYTGSVAPVTVLLVLGSNVACADVTSFVSEMGDSEPWAMAEVTTADRLLAIEVRDRPCTSVNLFVCNMSHSSNHSQGQER
ncbi:hypothetical protein BC828DRAFT_126810 [Blastocladiella britannica]|nr:hypothetical protein BC828DRAFT_126810 [Blastocladiella britannica]